MEYRIDAKTDPISKDVEGVSICSREFTKLVDTYLLDSSFSIAGKMV